jgi:hypothetical protein
VGQLWKKLNIRFHYIWVKPKNKKWSQSLTIKCNSVGSSAKLIRAIYPYLSSKRGESDILLEYANYREQLIKKRGPDGRYKEYMDREYIDDLINKFHKVKHTKYDLKNISRKANSVLDLTNLCSSETTCEALNE